MITLYWPIRVLPLLKSPTNNRNFREFVRFHPKIFPHLKSKAVRTALLKTSSNENKPDKRDIQSDGRTGIFTNGLWQNDRTWWRWSPRYGLCNTSISCSTCFYFGIWPFKSWPINLTIFEKSWILQGLIGHLKVKGLMKQWLLATSASDSDFSFRFCRKIVLVCKFAVFAEHCKFKKLWLLLNISLCLQVF